jgi:hypothetical protein
MKMIKTLIVAASVWTGLVCVCPTAQADVYTGRAESRQIAPIRSAEDVVAELPVIARIPRSFVIGDGFKIKLTQSDLRIDHMATNSRAPVSRRQCMLSFHVASPVAFFGSQMELPILNATSLKSRWNMSSLGDYVLMFSKDAPVESPTFGLRLSARF